MRISRTSRTIDRRTLLRGAGAVAGATAATGLLSSCAGTSNPDDNVLRFWQFYAPNSANPAQSDWFTEMVDAWNAEHEPKIRLEFVPNSQYMDGAKLQTAFSAENGPDLFVISPGDFLRYANGGVLVDLTDYLTVDERADYYPELLESRMVDGRIYALPLGGGPLAIYYSVPAFERAGLSEGDLPRTWDQWLDIGEKLTTSERFGLVTETAPGYYQNFTWCPFVWMAGGGLPGLKGDPPFDSEATVRALRLFQQMVDRRIVPRTPGAGGSQDLVGNLGTGYNAMQYAGMWGVADLARGQPDLDYGVFRLPLPPGGEYVSATGGWAFAANARGKNPDAAARFCVWAIGSLREDAVDRVARWCTEVQSFLPYRRSAMRRAEQLNAFDSEQMRTFRDVIFPGARGEPRMPPELNKVISDALQACQLNDADPRTELDRAVAATDSILQGYAGASPV